MWCVIYNPLANCSKPNPKIEKLKSTLEQEKIPVEWIISKEKLETEKKINEQIAQGNKKFIVCGGDGTLNFCINVFFKQKAVPTEEILLVCFPVGSGNDWAKTHEIKNSIDELIKTLKHGTTVFHDVGCFETSTGNTNYYINVAGIGFDGYAAYLANQMKESKKSGSWLYIQALIKALKTYKCSTCVIKTENQEFMVDLFTLLAGICKYAGNGMKLLPDALFYDGKLDLTIVTKINKFKVVRNIGRLFKGNFFHNKEVSALRCETLEIKSENELFFQFDGETLQTDYIKIRCLPSALQVQVLK
jgi:YegS/Rv2252/BmrU family lipid kinase